MLATTYANKTRRYTSADRRMGLFSATSSAAEVLFLRFSLTPLGPSSPPPISQRPVTLITALRGAERDNRLCNLVIHPFSPNQGPWEAQMITAKVQLTQPLKMERQFVATSGSSHHMLLDDATGATGPKPIELIAIGLAGCTAFDVITVLRQKYLQMVTGYEVRVEADQAERPPQVFTQVRIHHVITGYDIDAAAIEAAIRLSEDKYCSVGAMVKQSATLHTTYEIVKEKTEWLAPLEETAGV